MNDARTPSDQKILRIGSAGMAARALLDRPLIDECRSADDFPGSRASWDVRFSAPKVLRHRDGFARKSPRRAGSGAARLGSWPPMGVADSTRDAHGALDNRPVQHLVKLMSVEDDAAGEELEVVWEIEPGTRVQRAGRAAADQRRRPRRAGGARRLPRCRPLGRDNER